MLPALFDHLWQSTLLTGLVWLLTLALRNNPARVRHGLWLAASLKFFVPLSLLIALGSHIEWRMANATTQPNAFVVIDEVSQPFTAPASSSFVPTVPSSASPLPAILSGIWVVGFIGISFSWWIRWMRIRAAARAGSPLNLSLPINAKSSSALMEPGVFGIFRPVLLLPEGIFDRLTPAQLKAVLAHELCHVRHRDNFIAAMHMFVETVFWFHPLVWWIGKRMVEERERACDEEALRDFAEPKAYAEGILNVCKLYVESPLKCVSGVTGGSNLKYRIEAIMKNRIVCRLNVGKKLVLAVAGIVALALPIVVGILNAPVIRAQSAAVATPKFEVASIRSCEGGGPPVPPPPPSPGRLNVCLPVMSLIMQAYGRFATGRLNPNLVAVSIEGGSAWIKSDSYRVTAKPDGNASEEMMRGPMMQALLEDRFKLKTHRETRDIPVYALTAAKGSLKLQPFKEGSCTPVDLTKPPAPPAPGQTFCDYGVRRGKGSGVTVEAQGRSLDEFSRLLGVAVDRPVIDKTGIMGTFDIHLDFAPDQGTPQFPVSTDEPAGGPSIFTAIQEQLGLKLEPAKGPGEFLVIDHVERPTEN
jgi:bla regulator protein BlaR1